MDEYRSRGVSYTAGFFMLIAFVIAGLMVVSLLNLPLWTALTGKSADVMQKAAWGPEDSNAMKVIQLVTVVIGFFIPTVIVAAIFSKKPLQFLGYNGNTRVKQAGLVLLIMGAALMVSASLSYFTDLIPVSKSWRIRFDKMEDDYSRQVAVIINMKSWVDYVLALLVMGLLPAVCEETLFRGGLQNFLSRGTGRPWLSIVIVSLLFSLAHISFYGFLSRFFLGMILGALFHYSGRLWLSILGHFINNAVAITVLFVYTQRGHTLQESMRTRVDTWWGILGLPVLIALFAVLRKDLLNKPNPA